MKEVNFPLCLAPMVGLSHAPLRMVLREYLPRDARTIWPTEMLNSRRLPNEKVGRTPETFRMPEEDHLVPQILGNEELPIAQSVSRLKEWGASGVDINMGCPVDKALKHNYGVALMGDASYAAEVVRMTRKNTDLPVSVKLRAGLQSDPKFLLEFAQGLVEAGASWLTLHPRTAEQKRRGKADWSQIAILCEHLAVPVIGNGDIQCVDDVEMMLKNVCTMAMSGRALAAKPWMLWQLGERLGFKSPKNKNGCAPYGPQAQAQEYGQSLQRLIDYMKLIFVADLGLSEDFALRKLRFHVRVTSVWLDYGSRLESLIHKAKSLNEASELLAQFFTQSLAMTERTDLRQ